MADVAELTMATRKGRRAEAVAEAEGVSKPFGRPPKPTGSPTQVRMDADIASQAKVLASIDGVSMTDYLSAILRPILKERLKAAGRKLSADTD